MPDPPPDPANNLPEDPDARPPDIWEPWMRKAWRLTFIDMLKKTGNRSASCRAAGISRTQLYRDLEDDEGFRQAFAEAMEEAMDLLEQVAWQRATVGQKIESTKIVTNGDGKIVLTETTETMKMSDTMVIFLLKGGRPQKYRDNVQVQHTGEGGGPVKVKVERERSVDRLGELLEIAHDLGWKPAEDPASTNGHVNGDGADGPEHQA